MKYYQNEFPIKNTIHLTTLMKLRISLLICSILSLSSCNGQSHKRVLQPSPTGTPSGKLVVPKPTYNIYLENSGSMNGYVQSQAEFKETVGNFLTDIEINDLAKSINLNYINSKILPIGLNIPSFINSLNPKSFINAGGKITSTDISKMLKSILDRTDDGCISIFISDCVFSPDKGVSAQEYLVNQQLEIKSNFAQKLNVLSYSTMILRLTARFVGTFFNCSNLTTQIDAQRPYYIWIIGKHEYIKELFEKVDLRNFKGGGVRNFYCLNNKKTTFSFAILNSPNFERDKANIKYQITNAKNITAGLHMGEFQISFGINLKDALIDDEYILDCLNYTIPANYKIEVKLSPIPVYTHIITMTTKNVKSQIINIKLKNELPHWVSLNNSINDTQIKMGEEMNKTFGIKNLIEGVFEAYLAKKKGKTDEPIFEIEISIN